MITRWWRPGWRRSSNDQPDIRVVATVGTVEAAITAASRLRPDVVLMDYRLPDASGIEGTQRLRALDDPPAVIMVTSVADRHVLAQALDAGCAGFASKGASTADLVGAVRAGAADESYFTQDVLKHLVHLRRFDQVVGGELTDREVEVLQATADGKTPDEIAEQLFLSTHTVKNHLRHAMSKLDAHTKLDAVVRAVRGPHHHDRSMTCRRPGEFEVVIADDDPSVLVAFRQLLDDHPGLRVVGSAESGHDAAELCARHRPHLALLDVMMPGGGVEGVAAVRTASPDTRVAFYTAQSDRRTRARLHAAGALAVFAKGAVADLAGELHRLLRDLDPALGSTVETREVP